MDMVSPRTWQPLRFFQIAENSLKDQKPTRDENVLDQVYTIFHSTVNLQSYLVLASLILVVFYYNRFVTSVRINLP